MVQGLQRETCPPGIAPPPLQAHHHGAQPAAALAELRPFGEDRGACALLWLIQLFPAFCTELRHLSHLPGKSEMCATGEIPGGFQLILS